MIKSEVLEETQWLLDALREAAGHQKTRKFIAPFIADYSIRNMSFFGLMGSDKMIELVEGLCNCLQMGENGSNLPSFLKMWRIDVAALTNLKRSARGCKRLYQRPTYNFLLDLPLYNDGQTGVFKYTIILQSSTHLLNTLTPFPQVITQYSLPRFPLFSTPLGESSTPLRAPITVCQPMGNPPIFLAPSAPRSCGYWNPESAGDLQQVSLSRWDAGSS